MGDKVGENPAGAARRRFLAIREKPQGGGGCSNTPPPAGRRLRTIRVEEVTLCRIRIGHTLATHRYLLCSDPRPRCSRCGEPLTVSHELVSCNRLVAERAIFFFWNGRSHSAGAVRR